MSEGKSAIICKLCECEKTLRNSHIIPSYVFKWLKKTSPTGKIRQGDSIDRRVQDGFKEYLLCENCEQMLSVWEKQFKDQFFDPATKKIALPKRYNNETALFLVSIVWRAVVASLTQTAQGQLTPNHRAALMQAELRWRSFLTGQHSNYGKFPVHLFNQWMLFDAEHPDIPGNWNRYLSRAVEIDFPATKTDNFSMVCVKMGPLSVYGHLTPPKHKWRGTRIRPSGGTYIPSEVQLPSNIFEYLRYRAELNFNIAKSISDTQSDKIDSDIRSDIERTLSSDSFLELQRDASRFQSGAFRIKKNE